MFANQLALMLVRASSRRRRGTPLAGDGRLTGALKLPYAPTGAQQRTIGEILGDMQQAQPMLRLLRMVQRDLLIIITVDQVDGGAGAGLLRQGDKPAIKHHRAARQIRMRLNPFQHHTAALRKAD